MIPPAVLAWTSIIPRGVWFGLAGAALLTLGYCTHERAANNAIEAAREEARADADEQWMQALDAAREEAGKWKRKYEAADKDRADAERKLHDETIARNAAVADALRLRGPGKAAAPHCRSEPDPELSAAAGGSDAAPAPADAPGDRLPEPDRPAVVPWGWLVTRAEEYDRLLSEAGRWRSWYRGQSEAHEKRMREMPEVGFGPPPD